MSQRVPNENNEALEPEVGLEQKLTAAIYARQSRVRDIAYSSCQSQIDMCWQLAANNNWNVSRIFSDKGQSSETLDRPQLTQLIAAIEAGLFRLVIVYSIDRLTRRLLHFQYLLEVFARGSTRYIYYRCR